MFAVIYQFEVEENQTLEFEQLWSKLTNFIIEYEGGLGSRLHKQLDSQNIYLAYAQWPYQETFEKSGNNLPVEAIEIRAKMRQCCVSVQTLFQLNVEKDLLCRS